MIAGLVEQGAPAAAAEDHIWQALDWARRAGPRLGNCAPRCALPSCCAIRAAKAALQPVYDRFTEGFDTVDLKTAKALLNPL